MNLESLHVRHKAVIPESYRDDMGHVNVTWYTFPTSITLPTPARRTRATNAAFIGSSLRATYF